VVLGVFHARRVELRGDAHIDVSGANDLLQHGARAVLELRLDDALSRAGIVVVGACLGSVASGARLVEHLPLCRDEGHPVCRQARHGGRGEMNDPGNLGRAERATRPEPQNDRGRRGLGTGHEDRLLRQYEVNARRLHGGERPDRPGNLPLERATIENALLELRRAEPHLVEALEAHAAPARQPRTGEFEPEIAHPRLRHFDGGAADSETVGCVELLELRDDGGRVVLL